MRKKISLIFLSLFFVLACRSEDGDLQEIDQIIYVYMKDSKGQDLLNSKISGSYKEILLKDLGGERDQVSIGSAAIKKDTDTLSYIEYIAGAKRVLTDSISPELKHYRSDVMLQLKKTAADSVDLDTMTVFYEWTPQVFRIKTINYNGKKIFSKTPDIPNRFTVVK